MIALLGGAFAFMIASGGLYGRGVISDGTVLEWAYGFAVLVAFALPLMLVVYLALLWRRGKELHIVLSVFLWSGCVIGTAFTVLAMLDATPEPTFPFVVYLLGIWGYLLARTGRQI